MKLLKWLANLIKKFPMKSIFITIIMIALLTIGIQNIFMATGDDTLVKTDTDVYQDNQMLEEEFGGEGIIVLYESDNILTPGNLEHMKGLEQELKTNDAIYSMMSPVTLVEEIAYKQSDTFQDGIEEIIEGLNDMGSQLTDISKDLKENAESSPEMEFPEIGDLQLPEMQEPDLPELGLIALPEQGETELPEIQLPEFGDTEVPNLGGQDNDISKAFSQIIEAQKNLGDGTNNLIGGYDQFGEQLNNIGENLLEMTDQIESTSEQKQLKETGQKIIGLSEQMSSISDDTSQLPEIPDETINGLNNIQSILDEQVHEQQQMLDEQQKKQTQMETELKEEQEEKKVQIEKQQKIEQEKMTKQMQNEQKNKQDEMEKEMREQQKIQENEMKAQMEQQQAEKEKEMKEFKDKMEKNQEEQAEMLSELGNGLSEMGENLASISESMEDIHNYSDIMTPGLPSKQATLDNMIYDNDDELRSIFDDVVVDDNQMLMTIKLEGKANDTKKSDVINNINTYLDNTESDSLETLVSGKPVLDDSIKSSMQESIQKMMGLALLLMVIVLFIVFKVRWRLLPLLIVLTAVIGTVGLMGWLQIPITMVSMAVFPILIGLGIDYAIQFQNRYTEELTEEDEHE